MDIQSNYYLGKGNCTIIWHIITNDETYEDKTGYKKVKVPKRKIVETEIFSIDKQIKMISKIFAIMGKEAEESI